MADKDIKIKYLKSVLSLYEALVKKTDNEYDLERDSKYIDFTERREEILHTINSIKKEIKQIEIELSEIAREASEKNVKIVFEEIGQKYQLKKEEKYILWIVFAKFFLDNYVMSVFEIMRLIGFSPESFFENLSLFQNLLDKQLLIRESAKDYFDIFLNIHTRVQLSPSIMTNIIKCFAGPRICMNKKQKWNSIKFQVLKVRKPLLSSKMLVLSKEKEEMINRIINYIRGQRNIRDWNIDSTIKYGKGITVLFYGLPGTGKTATAEAIAHALGKKIGIVRYANILNVWIGESEKCLESVFVEAKMADCVLLFDEADALFARRLNEIYSTDRMHNYMTNILMQNIERYNGIVILTTNRNVAMDEAFNRRILFKMRFDIPAPEERMRIWRILIPEEVPLDKDVNFRELGSRFELTGGEIKNVILKAVIECGEKRLKRLPMSLLIKYAQEEMELKAGNVSTRSRVGFVIKEKDTPQMSPIIQSCATEGVCLDEKERFVCGK